jgi:glycosyltransferase involved in cell wall biosynthesis
MPRLSVIIPSYQRSKTILRALESVSNQTFRDFEIIVIDDGSTDGTADVVSQYSDKVVYIWQPNRGPSAARNVGIENSSGEFIAFLDADDIWYPQKIEKQISPFQFNPRLGLVCSDVVFADESGIKQNKTAFASAAPERGMIFNTIFSRSFIGTSTVVIRRICLDEVGQFDEQLKFCEDYELWLRVSESWEIDYVPEPLVQNYLGKDQLSCRRLEMLEALLGVQKKALANHPDLYHLDKNILESCHYDNYLKLAKQYLLTGQKKAAKKTLNDYHFYRGFSLKYLAVLIISVMPRLLLKTILDNSLIGNR